MKKFDIVIVTWFLIVLICILFGSNTEGQRVLNARLPFGVKGKLISDDSPNNIVKLIEIFYYQKDIECQFCLIEENKEFLINHNGYEYKYYLSKFRPYLFPLSSMTEEQEKESNQILLNSILEEEYDSHVIFDYYNEHHFDYRGLIKKGLAIDATNLNIY